MHRRWIFVLFAIVLVAAFAIEPASATGWFGHSKKPVYYLALGTSLAAGIQADRDTCQSILSPVSYPKFLEWKIRKRVRNARLVNLGCPGETSKTFIKGGLCEYTKKSQLKEAIKFLKKHADSTELVTIDLGANDVLPCLELTSPEDIAGCFYPAVDKLERRLKRILRKLQRAAPDVPIIGMNYYNPTLALWVLSPEPPVLQVHFLADLQRQLNERLWSVYEKFGIPVADVAGAFSSEDFGDDNGNTIPNNVEKICGWTWMCSCANIHANWIGYWKMADAFEDELPDSLTCRPPWWFFKHWH